MTPSNRRVRPRCLHHRPHGAQRERKWCPGERKRKRKFHFGAKLDIKLSTNSIFRLNLHIHIKRTRGNLRKLRITT